METEIFHLNLISPIYVAPVEKPNPFKSPAEGGGNNTGAERVFCFELDAAEGLAFEPDQDKLLCNLVFGGEAVDTGEAGPGGDAAAGVQGKAEIPQGKYLFAQKRRVLGKEEIIAMAVEIQTEGLWQRLKPGENLYLRYLFEDGSWVTQLFRPYL